MTEEDILYAVAEEEPCDTYFLNIFNLVYEAEESDIRKFYKDLNILDIHRSIRDAADLEFKSKDLLIKAIDYGTGTIKGQPFYIRSSFFRSRNNKTQGRGGRGGRGGRDRYSGSRGGYRWANFT